MINQHVINFLLNKSLNKRCQDQRVTSYLNHIHTEFNPKHLIGSRSNNRSFTVHQSIPPHNIWFKKCFVTTNHVVQCTPTRLESCEITNSRNPCLPLTLDYACFAHIYTTQVPLIFFRTPIIYCSFAKILI